MNRKTLVIIALLAGAALAYGAWIFGPSRDTKELTLYGNVDIREVNLGFRVSGRILEVLKDEGDSVKPGEIVARLDAEPYKKQVDQAKAQIASLAARLKMMESGYRREDIATAEAAMREREATLANTQRNFERQKELVAKKVVSQQDYDNADQMVKEATARLNSARAQLQMQKAGFRVEEVDQARAELQKAEASLASSEISLQDTEIRAPSAGVVMTRALEPGAIVQPGATVVTVSLSDPVWARVYVNEPELGLIHPGMEAKVYTDSQPNKPYDGKIGFISPRAEFTPKTVETKELRTSLVYRLRVMVPNPDQGLRQGMPVTVKLAKPPATDGK
ncbi:MAG: secretion protein HlyD [Candidatus Methylacidiphilales bacterium]|nr:secretion protein HlyD [Candidatus Methylacidiphilales bacterium]